MSFFSIDISKAQGPWVLSFHQSMLHSNSQDQEHNLITTTQNPAHIYAYPNTQIHLQTCHRCIYKGYLHPSNRKAPSWMSLMQPKTAPLWSAATSFHSPSRPQFQTAKSLSRVRLSVPYDCTILTQSIEPTMRRSNEFMLSAVYPQRRIEAVIFHSTKSTVMSSLVSSRLWLPELGRLFCRPL